MSSLVLLFSLCLNAVAVDDRAKPAAAPSPPPAAFAGCWHDVDEPTRFVELVPGKLRVIDHGELEITRVTYTDDSVVRHVWGKQEKWALATKDGKLTITAYGKPWILERAADRPAELDPKPLALGPRVAIDSARLDALSDEFARRMKEDQDARGANGKEPDLKAMERVDPDNTKWLKELVAEIGWIDADRFGERATKSAFLIVQHSGDLPLMLAALPEIEKDVKAKKLDAQNFALLWDRTQIRLGEKQRYGSQLGEREGGVGVVIALEDRANVEKLRAGIGLFPLTKYIEMMKQITKEKEIVFEDDETK